MKQRRVRITKGIMFSIPRGDWVCSWCEEKIKIGEETLLFSGLDKRYDGKIYSKMSGARIHLGCLDPMCAELKDAAKNKIKYAIVNSLEEQVGNKRK